MCVCKTPDVVSCSAQLDVRAVCLPREICRGILCDGIANKYNGLLKTKQREKDGSSSPSCETTSVASLPKKELVFRHGALPQPKAPILGNLNPNPCRKTGGPLRGSSSVRKRKDRLWLRKQSAHQLRGEPRSVQEELSHLCGTHRLGTFRGVICRVRAADG